MADYKVTDTELTSIANAIRTKGGTQAQLEFPTGFVSAVQAIPSGGGGESYFKRLEPLHEDLSSGYVSGTPAWVYSVGSTQYYNDVYLLEANKRYLITLGSQISDRFRAVFLPSDPALATSDINAVRVGPNWQSWDDFSAYSVATPFTNGISTRLPYIPESSDSNLYLVIGKSTNSTAGIKTYVFEVLY